MRNILLASAVRFSADNGSATAEASPGIGHNQPPADTTADTPKVEPFHTVFSKDLDDSEKRLKSELTLLETRSVALEQSNAAKVSVLLAEYCTFLKAAKPDWTPQEKSLREFLTKIYAPKGMGPVEFADEGEKPTVSKDIKNKSQSVMFSQLRGKAVRCTFLVLDAVNTSFRQAFVYRDETSPTGFRFAERRATEKGMTYMRPDILFAGMSKEQKSEWLDKSSKETFCTIVFDAWVLYPKLEIPAGKTPQIVDRPKMLRDVYGHDVPNTLMISSRHVDLAYGLQQRTHIRSLATGEIVPKAEKSEKTKAGQGTTKAEPIKLAEAPPMDILGAACGILKEAGILRALNRDELKDRLSELQILISNLYDEEDNLKLPAPETGKRQIFDPKSGSWIAVPVQASAQSDAHAKAQSELIKGGATAEKAA